VFGTIIVAALLTGLVSSVLTAPFGDNYAAVSIVAAIASPITMPAWPGGCVHLPRPASPKWNATRRPISSAIRLRIPAERRDQSFLR